ncbi:MAG: hypothetical protein AAGC92_05545 [Pseudomonadota bacterium]
MQMDEVLRQVPDAAPAIHDTYYIVDTGRSTMMIGAVLAVIGAIIWAQTRFRAMRYPGVTNALFLAFAWRDRRRHRLSKPACRAAAGAGPIHRHHRLANHCCDRTRGESPGAARCARPFGAASLVRRQDMVVKGDPPLTPPFTGPESCAACGCGTGA